ncbi:MmyB family transcriptional regulator [Plantactinospora sonchi]|uniref:MmyB-like transcription regulator ligand binding domain-containing protein n=1 Tax=Plantactinospora sonchi TaxID=1544735 RepID=A0ABU7RZF4_9ACTN
MALFGDERRHTGLARSLHYRWFTDPATRLRHPAEDRAAHSRLIAANLHAVYTRDGAGSRVGEIVTALLAASPEFAELWREHLVPGPYCAPKRIRHPEVGLLELHCQTLVDPDQSQLLLVFTAAPGSESHERLRLLSVVGDLGLGV